MDFIALDTIQSGTADPQPQPPNPPTSTRVDMGDCYQQVPISYEPQTKIKTKSKGNGRLKLAMIIGGAVMIGVAINNAANLKSYMVGDGNSPRPQPTESPTPDMQLVFTSETLPDNTTGFSVSDVDPNLPLRNAYIDRAVEASETQRKLVDESAADNILADARKANRVKGIDYQLYLMQRVTSAQKEVNNLIASGIDLTSTDGVRRSWILSSQLRALSIAWQRVNTQDSTLLADGVVVPKFTTISDLATITAELGSARDYAIAVRSATHQQVLRNQKALDDAKAKEQLKLLQEQRKLEAEKATQANTKGRGKNGQ